MLVQKYRFPKNITSLQSEGEQGQFSVHFDARKRYGTGGQPTPKGRGNLNPHTYIYIYLFIYKHVYTWNRPLVQGSLTSATYTSPKNGKRGSKSSQRWPQFHEGIQGVFHGDIHDKSGYLYPKDPCMEYLPNYIGIILNYFRVNVGKYFSTMDSLGYSNGNHDIFDLWIFVPFWHSYRNLQMNWIYGHVPVRSSG